MGTGRVFAFRTDASPQIGSGHVIRCLTLADALAAEGNACNFLCRPGTESLFEEVRRRGHSVHELGSQLAPEEGICAVSSGQDQVRAQWRADALASRALIDQIRPDWLVVDHYSLDARWELVAKPSGCRLLVIDDLADRPHIADVLLDQNLGREERDYAAWLPPACNLLLGPRFALLRPEFSEWRKFSLARRRHPRLQALLVTLGGVDISNATGSVLTALKSCPLPEDCKISVIMGRDAPWLKAIQAAASSLPWPTTVEVNVSNMAEQMALADLAIGAGGGTAWERCCVGLPSLTLVLADNQINTATSLHNAGAAVNLGKTDDLRGLPAQWIDMTRLDRLQAMTNAAALVADGNGAVRLCQALN